MAQETTKEFAFRLNQALDGSLLAPTESYGRLTWLKRELEARTGLAVSVNTVHKWVHGMSRPREDNIRQIANVLKVDSLWLSMGHMPDMATARPARESAAQAQGATLLAAGLIEMSGGRVTFEAERATLHVNLSGKQFDLLAVAPQAGSGPLAFIVPEPIGAALVLGVLLAKSRAGVAVKLLDLTTAKRQRLGGFSVVMAEENGGEFHRLLDIRELAGT